MTTVIVCTHTDCRKSYRVPSDVIGRKVKCNHCGRTFVATCDGPDSSIEQSVNSTLRSPDQSPPPPAKSPAVKSPAAKTPAKTPQRIGRFEVRQKLGHGAFGNVYRAFDPQLERDVAIKVPQPGLLATPQFVQRFLREAKAAARLNHPHIVPVYDAGQDGDQSYIAAKFIDGRPLADLIDELSHDYRRIAEIVRQIADALHYAHTQKIIHRDIKSHNVMIDTAGEPHLMDFGLAHLGTDAQKLTHDGALMGTPAYMSPEQAAAKTDEITAASDQYSLGVVLYELLTGDTPFAGPPSVVIFNILNRPLPTPRSVNPKIPRDLETICLKALARERKGRYENCGAFAADLDRWLSDRPITARRASWTEQTLRWCRRNPVVAGLSLAVLAAILIGGGTATMFGLIAQQRAAALGTALTDVNTQKTRADEKAEEAKTALAQLEPERTKAEAKTAEALRRQSNQEMILIQQDWDTHRLSEVHRRLNRFLPVVESSLSEQAKDAAGTESPTEISADKLATPESSPYRGLEWHYWNQRLASRQRQITPPWQAAHRFPYQIQFHPDGKQIICLSTALIDDKSRSMIECYASPHKLVSVPLDESEGIGHFLPDGEHLIRIESLRKPGDSTAGSPQLQQELTLRRLTDLSISRRIPVSLSESNSNEMQGEELFPWPNSFVVSPDSKSIAVAGRGGRALVIELQHPTKGRVFGAKEHPTDSKSHPLENDLDNSQAFAICYSSDGRQLARANNDLTISIWDLSTGKESIRLGQPDLQQLWSRAGWISQICFNLTGTQLCVNRTQGIECWDLKENQTLKVSQTHRGKARKLLPLPNDGGFLVASESGEIDRFVERDRTFHQVMLAQLGETLLDVVLTPQAIRAATQGCEFSSHHIHLWRVGLSNVDMQDQLPLISLNDTGQEYVQLMSKFRWGRGPEGTNWQISVESDGETSWIQQNGSVQQLQEIKGDVTKVFWLRSAGRVILRNETMIAAWKQNEVLPVWKILHEKPHSEVVCLMSPNQQWLLRCAEVRHEKSDPSAGGKNVHAALIDADSGRLLGEAELSGCLRDMISVDWSGQQLAYLSLTADGTNRRTHLHLFELPTLNPKEAISIPTHEFPGHRLDDGLPINSLQNIVVSPKSRQCAVWTVDGNIYLFSIDRPMEMKSVATQSSSGMPLGNMVFSSDGERLVTVSHSANSKMPALQMVGGSGQILRVWDSRTASEVLKSELPRRMLHPSQGLVFHRMYLSDDGSQIMAVPPSGDEQVWLDATPLLEMQE